MGGGISLNGKSILDLTYPIGSLYISKENVSPASLFGGTWEQVAEGYTLWTTTTSGEGGKKISAGLPNITGELSRSGNPLFTGDYPDVFTMTGALKNPKNSTFKKFVPVEDDYSNMGRITGITFNAALSNSIYGNSNTVQPPAIKTYMWIRIS